MGVKYNYPIPAAIIKINNLKKIFPGEKRDRNIISSRRKKIDNVTSTGQDISNSRSTV